MSAISQTFIKTLKAGVTSYKQRTGMPDDLYNEVMDGIDLLSLKNYAEARAVEATRVGLTYDAETGRYVVDGEAELPEGVDKPYILFTKITWPSEIIVRKAVLEGIGQTVSYIKTYTDDDPATFLTYHLPIETDNIQVKVELDEDGQVGDLFLLFDPGV